MRFGIWGSLAPQLGALYWLSQSSAACESVRISEEQLKSSGRSLGSPADRLLLVQAVFRHGARTPLTDKYWEQRGVKFESGAICGELLPHKVDITVTNGADGGPQPFSQHDARQAAKVLPGGCSKGELTLVGQQQALNLGSWLRRRYVEQLGFLPHQHEPGCVSGRTTNYRRTIGTLEYAVAGLYSSSSDAIPITTASEMEEILFGNARNCEQLGALMKAQRQALQDAGAHEDAVRELEVRVHRAMGTPQDGRVSFVELHDALTTLRFHDKPLPGEFDEELLLAIEKEATRRMLGMIAPDTAGKQAEGQAGLLRLGVGRLAAEIVDRMDAAIAGDAEHRMYMYSGHDTTIMPLLRALGLKVERWPGYCSNLIVELWERPAASSTQNSVYLVRMLYNGEALLLPSGDADGVIELEQLRHSSFGLTALTSEKYSNLCKLQLQREDSTPVAGEAGDAIQGL